MKVIIWRGYLKAACYAIVIANVLQYYLNHELQNFSSLFNICNICASSGLRMHEKYSFHRSLSTCFVVTNYLLIYIIYWFSLIKNFTKHALNELSSDMMQKDKTIYYNIFFNDDRFHVKEAVLLLTENELNILHWFGVTITNWRRKQKQFVRNKKQSAFRIGNVWYKKTFCYCVSD